MVDDVRDRARPTATDQKKQQYGRMKGIAHAVRAASDDLSNQGQPMVAEYFRDVAEGLESMAQSLGRRNVDALVGSSLRRRGGRIRSRMLLHEKFGEVPPSTIGRHQAILRRILRWQDTDDGGGAEHINCGDAPLGDGYGQQREGAV